MEQLDSIKLQKAFLFEFYNVIQEERNAIKNIIIKKIGSFPEALDIEYIISNCISDIEGILVAQITENPKGHFNKKEKQRKLTLYSENKSYVKKYVLEAAKYFCRKKQNYWTHGRNKAKTEIAEKHKEKKVGRAARVHWTGAPDEMDNWLNNIITSELTKDSLQIETIEHLNLLFEKIGFKEEKVACFWDRFDGMTFVEMANIDPSPSAKADKYRKRFNRVITQLNTHSDEFKRILMGDYD